MATPIPTKPNLINDTGIPNDDRSSDLAFGGTTSAGATVRVRVRDENDVLVVKGKTTADSNGDWSFSPTGLADGRYSLQTNATFGDGTSSGRRFDQSVKLDTTADARDPASLDVRETGDDVIDASEASNVQFKVDGLDNDASGVVVFSDGVNTVSVNVTADGTYFADLSGLNTATITTQLQITDTTGNTTTITGESFSLVICFMPGTMIRTPDGEAAVETLRIGDLVLTADGEVAPVKWMGRQTVSRTFGDPARILPIRIRAGALGNNLPVRDLLVSPDHALLVDGILVHAAALVNGMSILRETATPVVFTYHHVELADHSLILAEGVPAETFVDNLDRLAFDNWDEHKVLYPQRLAIQEMALPRAKSVRQVPRASRVRLEARAVALFGSATTVAA